MHRMRHVWGRLGHQIARSGDHRKLALPTGMLGFSYCASESKLVKVVNAVLLSRTHPVQVWVTALAAQPPCRSGDGSQACLAWSEVEWSEPGWSAGWLEPESSVAVAEPTLGVPTLENIRFRGVFVRCLNGFLCTKCAHAASSVGSKSTCVFLLVDWLASRRAGAG
eukprot:360508-Chlamydomonas_euryale.AAC.3